MNQPLLRVGICTQRENENLLRKNHRETPLLLQLRKRNRWTIFTLNQRKKKVTAKKKGKARRLESEEITTPEEKHNPVNDSAIATSPEGVDDPNVFSPAALFSQDGFSSYEYERDKTPESIELTSIPNSPITPPEQQNREFRSLHSVKSRPPKTSISREHKATNVIVDGVTADDIAFKLSTQRPSVEGASRRHYDHITAFVTFVELVYNASLDGDLGNLSEVLKILPKGFFMIV